MQIFAYIRLFCPTVFVIILVLFVNLWRYSDEGKRRWNVKPMGFVYDWLILVGAVRLCKSTGRKK